MGKRQVRRLAFGDGQRDADDARCERVQAGRFGIQGGQRAGADLLQPAFEGRLVEDRFVACTVRVVGQQVRLRRRGQRRRQRPARRRAAIRPLLHLTQPGAHFVAGKQLGQAFPVDRARPEVGQRQRQFEVAANGDQAPRQRQEVERAAQVLADNATDIGRGGNDAVERAVLAEPLDRRLGADLVDAGDVVDAIADQRQVIDDALGGNAELGEHAGFVEHLVAHRVDQLHMRTDQLRQILVAGRHHHGDALRRRLLRQRADDVVRLDPVDAQ
jgi:hypothetical protein